MTYTIVGIAPDGTREPTISRTVESVEFPYTLAITPRDNDAQRRFEVSVDASLDGSSVRGRVISGFVHHETTEIDLALFDSCVGATCGSAETCVDGSCQSAEVPLSEHRPFTPTPLLSDSGVDASFPDVGDCEPCTIAALPCQLACRTAAGCVPASVPRPGATCAGGRCDGMLCEVSGSVLAPPPIGDGFEPNDSWGDRVATYGDLAVVGQPDRWRIHILRRDRRTWGEPMEYGGGAPRLGESVATNGEVVVAGTFDDTGDVGEPNVRVFRPLTGGAPLSVAGGNGVRFGAAVATSAKTKIVVVGSPEGWSFRMQSGRVHLYRYGADATNELVVRDSISSNAPVEGQQFGRSVAIVQNANNPPLLVGGRGFVERWVKVDGLWTFQDVFRDGRRTDFGRHVAWVGERVAISDADGVTVLFFRGDVIHRIDQAHSCLAALEGRVFVGGGGSIVEHVETPAGWFAANVYKADGAPQLGHSCSASEDTLIAGDVASRRVALFNIAR